ncbi:hypothetical protein [Hungatella hathewayi]|uniref:hypothetical protein n=1 Tax=Hungatella hathewayi TaxID=154046 RepID=UPI0035658348
MENIKEYEALAKKQNKPFAELSAQDIISAIAHAGRNNDVNNMRITISDDENRYNTILDINYEVDQESFEEYIELDGPNKSHYSIPIMKENSNEFNYRELDNRLNQFKREYGSVEMYIDNQFMRDAELERTPVMKEEMLNRETINMPESAVATVAEESGILQLNHKRTKLAETEIPVDIRDIARRLEDKGYLIKVKQGGHLLVQVKNLSSQNSITVTRKNAYIEDANIQSPYETELYHQMKKEVLQSVDDSFSAIKEKNHAFDNFTEFKNISILQVTKELLDEHNRNEMNLNFVFEESKLKYQFLDDKGKDYISLSLDYTVNDDHEKTVSPVISVKYGPEYGNLKKTFNVNEADLEALKKDELYKTDLAKEIDVFAGIGKKERTSNYELMKASQVKKILDKDISKEFKFLNHDKIEYFSDVALDYYRKQPDCTLAEYQIEKLKEAPFYRTGMSNSKITKALNASFDYIEKRIDDPGLNAIEKRFVNFNDFSCRVYKDGAMAMDTKAKEPVTYDREWITKLARLEDSIMELRYGPIQDALNIATSLGKGSKELVEGIAEYKSDGIYSGFDIGKGIGTLKEGWQYGAIVSDLEREYKKLALSENENDKIAAIDKKIDLKLLREDIHANMNIYTKAAIALRENCDKMIDAIRDLRTSKEKNTLTESKLQSIKKQFAKYSKVFVTAYNTLNTSLHKINTACKDFSNQQKEKGRAALDYMESKGKAVTNSMKSLYNDISKKAQLLLDMKAFTNERIAEQLNDIKVVKSFESIKFEEFGIPANAVEDMRQELKFKFWKELDNSIIDGENTEKIPFEEQTKEDRDAIQFGRNMKFQKERNMFVAEKIHDELKHCYKENLSYSEAIEHLSKTYHNENMIFNLRNRDDSIKNYSELSSHEKQTVQEIIKDFIHTIPSLEEAFLDNERTENQREEREDKWELSAIGYELEPLMIGSNDNAEKDDNSDRDDDR